MSDLQTYAVWLVKATALLMLAMGVTMGLRRAPAGARYLVWLATLVALIMVPPMNAWSPIPLAILPTEAPAIISATQPASNGADRTPPASNATIPAAGAAGTVSRAGVTMSLPMALTLAWASVAALLLTWLTLGALSVRRITRGARTLTNDAWLTPLYETADRLDLDRVPRLIMSGAIEMPFACSILHPTIVLPASAEQWSDERRRVVLFHELAHIRRRDLLGHTLGRLVCAFYWFHPMVWSAAKQLRAESERACDDLVLACGARASDYANHLLEIVTNVRRQGAPATALPMANKREFEGRMLAILDPAVKRATPSRAQQLLLTLGLGTVAMTIAAVAPTRHMATVETLQTQSATRDSTPSPSASPTSTRTTSRTATPSPTPSPSPTSVGATSSSMRSETTTTTEMRTDVATLRAFQFEKRNTQQEQQRPAPDTALLGRILRTDKNADVRKAATWVLQGRRDGVPLLLERLRIDESADVRETAAWALADFATPDVATALAQALLKDKAPDVRGTAAWALGHARGSGNNAALEAALADDEPDVRQKALWALGQHSLDAAPPRVVALLKDESNDVRQMAAWLLTEVMDKSALPALREAFMKENDSDAQEAEFRALLFMGDRSQAVIDRAMSSENPDLRARAVRMIAGHGPGVWPWPWPWPDPRPEP